MEEEEACRRNKRYSGTPKPNRRLLHKRRARRCRLGGAGEVIRTSGLVWGPPEDVPRGGRRRVFFSPPPREWATSRSLAAPHARP